MTPFINGAWCLPIVVCAAVAAEKTPMNAGHTAPRHLQVGDRIGDAGPNLPKPSCVVLLYTGHSGVGPAEPPTFVAVGDEDGIAPAATMERRVSALRKLGTNVDYRKYRGVAHGFGLGTGTTAEGWIEDAMRFWARQIKR
jgi:acetyl esterase/lipase